MSPQAASRLVQCHLDLCGGVAIRIKTETRSKSPPEPEMLKDLGETPDGGVKGHILDLLASQMPAVVDIQRICKRLGTQPQAHFPEPQAPRQVVITVCRKRLPAYDLTADGFFDICTETLICRLDSSMQVTSFYGRKVFITAISVRGI